MWRAGPRGRDVARKATWLCHVDTRAWLIVFVYSLLIIIGAPRV